MQTNHFHDNANILGRRCDWEIRGGVWRQTTPERRMWHTYTRTYTSSNMLSRPTEREREMTEKLGRCVAGWITSEGCRAHSVISPSPIPWQKLSFEHHFSLSRFLCNLPPPTRSLVAFGLSAKLSFVQSTQPLFSLPRPCPPFTEPCRIVFERPVDLMTWRWRRRRRKLRWNAEDSAIADIDVTEAHSVTSRVQCILVDGFTRYSSPQPRPLRVVKSGLSKQVSPRWRLHKANWQLYFTSTDALTKTPQHIDGGGERREQTCPLFCHPYPLSVFLQTCPLFQQNYLPPHNGRLQIIKSIINIAQEINIQCRLESATRGALDARMTTYI